jgi:Arm DNA-binding domain/Phage integrase central domain
MDGVTRGNSKPKRLTDLAIKNFKAAPKRQEISDGKNGLFIVVHPSGRKSFAVRYRFDGRSRKLTLPRGITLATARKAAADTIHEVEQGRDPGAAKRQVKEAQQVAPANTFRAIAEQYLEREAKKKERERLRSLKWRRALLERLVYPTLGDQPISTIKRKAIIELLDAIEDGKLINAKREPIKGGATTAHSTLAIIRKIMRWYAIRDEDYVVPIVPGMARIKPDERARSRVLSDDELRRVWRTAEDRSDPFAAMIRFMLLTACRRSEAAAFRWEEIV